jgi:hypothetical protein
VLEPQVRDGRKDRKKAFEEKMAKIPPNLIKIMNPQIETAQ